MLLLAWIYRYFFEILLSVLLDLYPEVRLLDHMVILFLIFLRTAILFSVVIAHVCIPTAVYMGSNFSLSS